MNKKIIISLSVTIIVILIIILGVTLYQLQDVFIHINNPEAFKSALDAYQDDLGIFRALILIFLEFLVVMLGIMPAEPVEIVAGLTYGALFGTVLCLIGALLANITIYLLFKKMGDAIVKYIPAYEKWENKLVNGQFTGVRIVNIVLLYVLPIIPYGVIAIIASRSKIHFIPYLIVTTLGVIPSIVICTFMTGSILEGNFIFTLVLIIIIVIAVTAVYIFQAIYKRKQNK